MTKITAIVSCVTLAVLDIAPVPAYAQAHEIVLHSFVPKPGGSLPLCNVVRDAAGNLYGTTQQGGAYGAGVVYKVDPATHQTKPLYSFTGGADGGEPIAGVILDP